MGYIETLFGKIYSVKGEAAESQRSFGNSSNAQNICQFEEARDIYDKRVSPGISSKHV